ERDPIPRYEQYLRELEVLNDDTLAKVRTRIEAEIEEAVDFAENSPRPAPDGYLSHVYAEDYPGFEFGDRNPGEPNG
ncbi:MAG: thiamine pyrophosphate-dependent enzyme, partial [Gemmatimonadota bacterium]